MSGSASSLDALRTGIDAIDREVVALLSRRGALAVAIGAAKRREGVGVQDRGREDAVLARVTAANAGPLSAEDLRRIYEEIIAACLRVQNALPAEGAGGGDGPA